MLIVEVLGGIGLFLLGMTLMTNGLQEAAADRLRGLLRRVTGSPVRGVAAGAAVTTLVQSSTATTLATIGFVSAGLLTFQQSIAVIVGSNIGTTSTGWLVAVLGFKVQVTAFALPMVALGVLLHMTGRERARPLGLAVAGFGVLFVGLDVLQGGMAGVADQFDLSGFGGESIGSRLFLVGVGFAMTVVMQSSSAAIVATLAAVHSEAIGVPAALALLVGQNVGTTATATVASIGATVPAKQTALAHVLFKVITAGVVFFLLPWVPSLASVVGLEDDPAVLLAAFHTAFSLLGALMILPFLGPFARLITRLIPERQPSFTRHLDASVASMPAIAVDAGRRAVLGTSAVLFDTAGQSLLRGDRSRLPPLLESRVALDETRDFLSLVRSTAESEEVYQQHLSVLHAIDHAERFIARLEARPLPSGAVEAIEVREAMTELGHALTDAARWCALMADVGDHSGDDHLFVRDALEGISSTLAARRESYRAATLEETARGECSPADAMRRLDAMYRVERLGYHAWRAVHHLSRQPDPIGATDDDD